jgi:MoaA/NifB/PqqE/SkfB family radical SAM enzyme
MKNTNNVSQKAVQHGLERQNTGKLQSLWIEFPGFCNLACSYCYADGGCPEFPDRLLDWAVYESILTQAKAMGVDSIGIPGAGEPLLSGLNFDLTMRFLNRCAELGFYVTLFTTGEFITSELAIRLFELPVEIMLKGNTLNQAMQDRFVSDPSRNRVKVGYGKARNEAIETLIVAGFADEAKCQAMFGRKSRMALVTSIMTEEDAIDGLSNYAEMADILRFCRNRNIIFDCDSVLKRGRGAKCSLCTDDVQIKAKLEELQAIDREEFGNSWELSQSYIGTVCDRYMHHMYISQYGQIRPCIGAMDVDLGNVRDTSLAQAWDSAEMQIIRGRQYGGVCGHECKNFEDKKCNSCLGRRAENLTNASLLEKNEVSCIGCWNFQKK